MAHATPDRSMQLKIMENTELMKVSDVRYKYIHTSYKKVSAKMFDYKCDIKLKVDDETFRAHKDVLADASDYFSAMFSHDMLEKEQVAVELHEISPLGFRAMLEYFYHGHVTIETANIEDVIEAARFFFIEWMLKICCDFLIRHLSMENFTSVLELADKYCLGDLRQDIFRYVGQNFVTLSRQPLFMQLSQDLLFQLLADDYFIDAPEQLVFNTVIKWLKHDLESREEFKVPVLQLIRYALMDPRQLNEISEDVTSHPEISPLINEAREYHEHPSKQCVMNSSLTEMRGSKAMLLLISALDDAQMIQYKLPDLPDFFQEEVNTKFLQSMLEFAAIASLGNFVFMAGGYDRDSYGSSPAFYRYNPRDRSWAQLANMQRPRVSFVLCAGNENLYAVAGIERVPQEDVDHEYVLNSVECYNPRTGFWTDLPALPSGCFSMGACVAHEKLYMSGGISDDLEDSVPSRSLLCYTPGDDEWVRKASMIYERQSHSMTPYQNKLYVFGGNTAGTEDIMSFEDSFTSEVYDIETDQWTRLRNSPQEYGHIHNSTLLFNTKIYLIGGKDVNRYLFAYNVDTQEYEEGEFCGEMVAKLASVNIALPFDIE